MFEAAGIMRVLVVEDFQRLRDYVARGLRNAGYAVDVADNGEDGLWMAQSNDYDVVVLDLMLPKIDGLTLLQRLREDGNATHVLILTARDTVDDRVRGLQRGADDYLIKPFELKELLARVQALARRSYNVKNSVIAVGDLRIDTAARVVSLAGEVLDLRPREFALLEYLALRQGQVVTRTEIESHIYDEQVEAMSNVVDSAVYQLRKSIDRPGRPSMIRTRRGVGYVLQDAIEESLQDRAANDKA
jgi:DNA-binding response OmpR family regulator